MTLPDVQLRDATAADAAACAAIYAPYVADTVISFETVPPTTAQMRERMTEVIRTHAWLVAEVDDTVIGYAYAHPFAPRAAYRWSCETSIYLSGDHRGAGAGRALYTELVSRLVARGYRTALGGMTLPNTASERLHLALGFRPVGVYRNVGWKHGAWHDVAWFQKDLGPIGDPPREPAR